MVTASSTVMMVFGEPMLVSCWRFAGGFVD
jgi:hypothetical protein